MKKALTALLLAAAALTAAASDTIDLSGRWQLALDRDGTFTAAYAMTDSILLPGTTDTNRRGDRRQFYASVLDYMNSSNFRPATHIGGLDNISPY